MSGLMSSETYILVNGVEMVGHDVQRAMKPWKTACKRENNRLSILVSAVKATTVDNGLL